MMGHSKENYTIGNYSHFSGGVICPLLAKYYSVSYLKVIHRWPV